MGKDKEALDSVAGRVATGIHLAAAATLIAPSSTREELDLASLILRRDPARAAPREHESTVETFNRLLDAAIESANDSAHCGTRAERRARLATDLGRAGVILVDCSLLAELVDAKLELDTAKLGMVIEPPGPVPLLEALEPSADERELEEELERQPLVPGDARQRLLRRRKTGEPRAYQPSSSVIAEEDLEAANRDLLGFGTAVTFTNSEGVVSHVPIGDFLEGEERSAAADHRVND
jgi:hypothetical protein